MFGAGLSKIFFGVGNTPWIWIPAQFCLSVFPLHGSSETAIWLAKVAPNIQGRVFAARSLALQFVAAIAYLYLEPAMMPSRRLAAVFSVFGIGTGAGMALLYTISALCMFLIGLWGFSCRSLRAVEIILPEL